MLCSIVCSFLEKQEIIRAIFLKKIQNELEEEIKKWEKVSEFDDIKKLTEKELKKYLKKEYERSKTLDDKLSKLTAILPAIVLIGGVYTNSVIEHLSKVSYGFKISIPSCLVLSVTYFLISVLYSFYGLNAKKRYGYGAGYINKTNKDIEQCLNTMKKAACAFQNQNLIRANYISAANTLIMWGIIFFMLTILMNMLSYAYLSGGFFLYINIFFEYAQYIFIGLEIINLIGILVIIF
ncbi:MAG: hypothetical protein M3Z82_08825 [Apilactobacillus sp.]|nr:hypothetical protein [Apilactobacillus sp.]